MTYNPENGPPTNEDETMHNWHLAHTGRVFFSPPAIVTDIPFTLYDLVSRGVVNPFPHNDDLVVRGVPYHFSDEQRKSPLAQQYFGEVDFCEVYYESGPLGPKNSGRNHIPHLDGLGHDEPKESIIGLATVGPSTQIFVGLSVFGNLKFTTNLEGDFLPVKGDTLDLPEGVFSYLQPTTLHHRPPYDTSARIRARHRPYWFSETLPNWLDPALGVRELPETAASST